MKNHNKPKKNERHHHDRRRYSSLNSTITSMHESLHQGPVLHRYTTELFHVTTNHGTTFTSRRIVVYTTTLQNSICNGHHTQSEETITWDVRSTYQRGAA